jgi:hypothetical protein
MKDRALAQDTGFEAIRTVTVMRLKRSDERGDAVVASVKTVGPNPGPGRSKRLQIKLQMLWCGSKLLCYASIIALFAHSHSISNDTSSDDEKLDDGRSLYRTVCTRSAGGSRSMRLKSSFSVPRCHPLGVRCHSVHSLLADMLASRPSKLPRTPSLAGEPIRQTMLAMQPITIASLLLACLPRAADHRQSYWGHRQPSKMQRYTHLDADPMRRAVETIGATIAAAMAGKGPRIGKGKRGV